MMLRRLSRTSIVLLLAGAAAFALVATGMLVRPHLFGPDAPTANAQSDGQEFAQATVRISALKSEDGAVRVALQQQGGDGVWHPRQHPRLNTVAASARTGIWLNSSPLHIPPPPQLAMPEESEPLYCIVHHGTPGDPFWRLFDLTINRHVNRLEIAANLEIHAKPNVAEQAAAITDCVAREARFIATTIPSAEGLRGAASAAVESGAFFMTFNSGADFAASLGSQSHVGLDDTAAGEIAGEQFNTAGVNGVALCVVHEPDNVGLADRCDGLASIYNGDVERVDLTPAALTDSEAATEAIASAVEEHDAGAVLVLVNALVIPAVAAADGAAVGAVSAGDNASIRALARGNVQFLVNPALQAQAQSLVGSMMLAPGRSGELLAASSRSAVASLAGTAIHLIRPRVLTAELLRTLLRENPEFLDLLGVTDGSGD